MSRIVYVCLMCNTKNELVTYVRERLVPKYPPDPQCPVCHRQMVGMKVEEYVKWHTEHA